MVQFKILSGKKAGSSWGARHFPVRVGRSIDSDLQLEEAGVWDNHFELFLDPVGGFQLETKESAFTGINGQPAQRAALRNGDIIEVGSIKIQFWISEPRQRGQGFREIFVWTMITTVCLVQIALVYWLLAAE